MRKFAKLNNFIKSLTKKNENGFSLLELVVSIAVVLVLTVGGLIGYSIISKNAKQAAVESAAAAVIKMIAVKESSMSFNASSNSSFGIQNIDAASNDYVYTKPQDAAEEWMRSAGDKNKINVTASEDDDLLTVKAVYDNNEDITATKKLLMSDFRGGSTDKQGGSDGDENNNGGENSGIGSEFTYKCDVDSEGPLTGASFKSGAKITMTGDGETKNVGYSSKNVDEAQTYAKYIVDFDKNYSNIAFDNIISDNVKMKAGVEYKVKIEGKFDILTPTLDMTKVNQGDVNQPFMCLKSVDKLDENSGLKQMSDLNMIDSITDTIPSTVESLARLFAQSQSFNDPNVSKWDTSNVTNMEDVFQLAQKFNQPLNDWDTSKVTNMKKMFGGSKFNQPLNKWDVSKVKNFGGIFNSAESFNQDISMWDTSSATDMGYMFSGASSFNSDLSKWNVDNVTDCMSFNYMNSDRTLPDEYLPKFKIACKK